MKEIEAKLTELEGQVTAFFGKLHSSLGATRAEIETVDQGPIAGLDAVLSEVESTRGFAMGKLDDVETRAHSLRPD